MIRRVTTRAAVIPAVMTVAAAAVLTATAPPAAATPRTNACGGSYAFLKSYPIKALYWTGDAGKTKGYIDIYYSSATGKNCAIARPSDGVHLPRGIKVKIGKSGSGWAQTDGFQSNYTKYAGPVYVTARNTCIAFEGGFAYNASWDPSEAWSSYSGKHCG
ncbi:hypothetical protein OG728_39585 (plasmid) [Streptomyces microflavus]|uniref:hypothetical protein n=1 Tax=Streptomyces microflavus TaxID=1919 RepID=UPI002E12681E|nr:hypothetical protein OG728_38180 [Streptomyces microflavus]WSR96576.1 hypothetical protein OG728_39585 [Streptomyces microflavus]